MLSQHEDVANNLGLRVLPQMWNFNPVAATMHQLNHKSSYVTQWLLSQNTMSQNVYVR